VVDIRRKKGNDGEVMAAEYLAKKGFEILDRQYLTRLGEIDLVARDGGEIVFVEVKARFGLDFGHPEESVTPSKLRKIANTAELYIRQKGMIDAPFRIDVVAIRLDLFPPEIVHLENVS
jgi:putative endonuclease